MNMLDYVKKSLYFKPLQTKQQNFKLYIHYNIIISQSYKFKVFIYAKCLNSTEPNQDSLSKKIKYR